MHILHPIAAFTDNYIWALHDGTQAFVVDPGDAAPVTAWLQAQGLALAGILITHHHADHTGGVAELMASTRAPAWGPAYETLPDGVQRLSGGEQVTLLDLTFDVIDVPGHTAGHIAYFCPDVDGKPLLFCGDTLFSGGCGRLFEGTPAQMLASLDRLAALPGPTRVCCTHEYTLANLRFAQAVEPHNEALAQYHRWCQAERDAGRPTLPSHLDRERAINPFLRSREPSVRSALSQQGPLPADDAGVFGALRAWKDRFR
ncbi:hydroxyacylglutathione hydrolase [Tepidicella baoligensis]|uniref:hydroxyacylglutathione hydrolase n=1 Tax=Tepidicella baoligensis TaxID=2707016 RepID=UPI0015DBC44E|nr:hydroxyacylglutathione hydrolase [Tepidicella baoligensis]